MLEDSVVTKLTNFQIQKNLFEALRTQSVPLIHDSRVLCHFPYRVMVSVLSVNNRHLTWRVWATIAKETFHYIENSCFVSLDTQLSYLKEESV
jgi:hypothetical protein